MVSTIRLVKSALSYARIEKGSDLTEDEVLLVISKEAKKRKESIEMAQKANREDIAAKEKEELDILKRYLPEEMDEAQVEAIISDVISQTGATSIKDRGKVMGAVMPKVRGKADGKLVSAIVERLLNG